MMPRCLLLDVGAGTLDVFWLDEENGLRCKAVLVSPVRTLAKEAGRLRVPLIVTGREMGGGEVSRALEQKSRAGRVIITPAAAATISHDLDKVRAMGLELMVEEQALGMCSEPGFSHLELGDIQPERLLRLLAVFDVGREIDEVGICLQDHGRPPVGVSHLLWRAQCFSELLSRPHLAPAELGFDSTAIPDTFGRMRSAAADAAQLGPGRIFVMDSSLAAVFGTAWQARKEGVERVLVVDVATSHTIVATFAGEKMQGYFELHTRDAGVEIIDGFVDELLAGTLRSEDVLARGGHGSWCRAGLDAPQAFLAVGPQVRLLSGSRHPFRHSAPLGDSMLAGCAGLLLAMNKSGILERWF